ncbi:MULTISPECIES: cysteine hydrolase family protein [unclassified Leclercia]|uniref:Isochorismatase family protein n=1 Tax=Leclercia barmai TaxID=2785629 RepID=A0ABS7RRA6_9ENTR|nr:MULTISPECIES: isochorismatase family protein [unclassified Leclercia]MBZ0056393.1 isochorismatase family protein [Leclercia sp. EMC7]MCM5694359.1 isochorismatase family protein [Leclercia sp. LTM01]MCM5699257.1 isochorismatase family protein [Leclercia sp. LTM14]
MSKALLIIDMQNFVTQRIQQGVDYFPQNSIENMTAVIEKFRKSGTPVIHVRHQTPEEGSPLHHSSSSSLPLESFKELNNEPVFIKHTSSAFSSTGLFDYLQDARISELVVIGAVAGFCVNSTVRTGADLGLKITVLKDAVISFELEQYQLSAKAILDVTLGLLAAGFAQVIPATELKV